MAGALATICGLALLGAIAVLVPATLRISGRSLFLLAGAISAAATIVGTAIALSILNQLNRGGWLIGEALVAAAAFAVWHFRGRPAPVRGWRPSRRALREFASASPIATAAAGLAALAMTVQFVVAVAVAPNNWDSMTYHLSRAAYWLQHDSARHFAGGTLRQVANAPNAELLQAWTMSLAGTDRYVELIQWAALLGLAVAIYAGARVLRFGRGPAVFAGALFVLLPEALMQATTTQNDLVVALFLVTAAVFAVKGLRDRHTGELIVSGAALGLAVGTKGTALFGAGAVGILVIGALVAYRPPRRVVAIAAAAAIGGVAAFGAFNYVLNQHDKGSLLGGVQGETKLPEGADVANNAVLVGWSFFDSPGVGIPVLDLLSQRVAELLPDETTNGLNTSLDTQVHEDASAFGLVGFVFLPAVLLFSLFRRRGPTARRLVAAASILLMLVMMWKLVYNPWWGRILLPMVAIGAPLLAMLGRRRALAAVVLVVAVPNAVSSVLSDNAKPLLVASGGKTIFDRDRLSQQTIQRPEVLPNVQAVFRLTGPDDAIGFVGGEDSWDYPFFGAHLNHRVVRFDLPQQVTVDVMKRYGLAGVVFVDEAKPPPGLDAQILSPTGYWAPASP